MTLLMCLVSTRIVLLGRRWDASRQPMLMIIIDLSAITSGQLLHLLLILIQVCKYINVIVCVCVGGGGLYVLAEY